MRMSTAFKIKDRFPHKIIRPSIWKTFLIAGAVFYFIYFVLTNNQYLMPGRNSSLQVSSIEGLNSSSISPTNINHLLFGLVGSEKALHHRKAYIEAWWRSNITRGYLYLDASPINQLLPWSSASPPYRVSEDITKFLGETKPIRPVAIRIVHGIMEIFREYNEQFRWLVMGDDDSILFLDNIVDVLAQYDHSKYYYFGGQSEFLLSNYWCSFNQGFGVAGFILSYPLAKALANYMNSCLRRYAHVLRNADRITMTCIADIGVNLSPHKGLHQIDLTGDISGFLSSHPKSPLLSLHHFDVVEPIFPSMDRIESTQHLMKAANLDQSRMLQQIICYQRKQSWSISISWGYSVHIYEKIMPRSWLQNPIETFKTWTKPHPHRPYYMLDTRQPTNHPCEAPHVFFLKSIEKVSTNQILTTYYRSTKRGLSACQINGSHSADLVSEVHVYSSAKKRIEVDRCECCDITYSNGTTIAMVNFRECHVDEIIA